MNSAIKMPRLIFPHFCWLEANLMFYNRHLGLIQFIRSSSFYRRQSQGLGSYVTCGKSEPLGGKGVNQHLSHVVVK